MRISSRFSLILIIGLLLVAAGCASAPAKPGFTPIQKLGAPKWVFGSAGSGNGKYLYAVGSCSNINNNLSLLIQTADNRAKNAMASQFRVYTASLMKDYASSTEKGGASASSEEQLVEQAIKTVTAMTLSGVQIVDHWQNPQDGTLFSLARLDFQAFSNNISKMKELDEKTKKYIRRDADRLHSQLSKEEQKVNGGQAAE
ncbi:MAG: LPP20 family lipoprotein [Nitrospiraceae bacterium]|nr:LPP20 family lipoprotein [Nitrospiraceae bacterium]